MALCCAISNDVPEHPVISPVSGSIFEKRLVEKYVIENGVDPINGKDLTIEQLIEVKTPPLVKPKPPSATSIPAILKTLQDEWDAVMLRSFTQRQQLQTARQELSHARNQHDAACRVIAQLTKEVTAAREALATLMPQAAVAAPVVGTPINDLPNELLVRIMSHLSLFHRKRTREVCSHWEVISYDRSLIRDDWMVVPTLKDLKKLEDRAPYKKFLNLRIENMEDDLVEMPLWQKFGPFIQNIEFGYVEYDRNLVFAYIFKYCNDLKSISLRTGNFDNCTSLINNERVTFAQLMPSGALSKLTSIMLEDHRTLTNAEFNALTRNSLHLTSIHLEFRSNVSFESVRKLLVRQSKKITHLALSKMMDGEKQLDLVSCVGSQLTSLRLASCTPVPEEYILKVCALFPNLEELALEYKISSKGVEILLSSLKKLKSIVLYDAILINFPISNLNNLRYIELLPSYDISEHDLIAAFTRRPLPNLETLHLSSLTVSDKVVCAISPMIPNVKILFLKLNDNLTAVGMQSIIKYNKGLRILSLRGCSSSQIFSHTTSINDLTELRVLRLDFCPGMDESWIESISLKRLRKLILERFPAWPTSCFAATLIEACPLLEIIDIPTYPEDVDTKNISARAKKILPIPCSCSFSEEKHLTRKCQS